MTTPNDNTPRAGVNNCIACGAHVPDRQQPPYPGHTEDCALVAAWNTTARAQLADAQEKLAEAEGAFEFVSKKLEAAESERSELRAKVIEECIAVVEGCIPSPYDSLTRQRAIYTDALRYMLDRALAAKPEGGGR